MRERKLITRFLRLFPEYRDMEERCAALVEDSRRLFGEHVGLQEATKKKDEALELDAAIIRSYKSANDGLYEKAESDASLIESLNRYIGALEGKAEMQAAMLRELKQKLKVLLPRNKKTITNNRARKGVKGG